MKNILFLLCLVLTSYIQGIAQTATINISTTTPCVGQIINFSYDQTGLTEPISCVWDFGDGSVSTDCSPIYLYNWEGSFLASLTLIDNNDVEVQEYIGIDVQQPLDIGYPTFYQRPCYSDPTLTQEVQYLGYEFYWSDGSQGENQYYYLDPGNYSVEIVETSTGCSYVSPMTILPPPNPALEAEITIIDPSECNIDDGSINITTTGGTPPYTYFWSGPNGFIGSGPDNSLENLSGSDYGLYNVVIQDNNGCYININGISFEPQNALLPPNIIITDNFGNIDDDGFICDATSVTLDATTPGVDFYIWSNASTEPLLDIEMASGNYSVTLTNTNGCTSSGEVSIIFSGLNAEIIVIDNNGSSTLCSETASTTLDAGTGFASYEWSTGENTQTIDVTAGTYTVTIMDNNGCSNTDTIVITESSTPDATFSITETSGNTPNDANICEGDSIILTIDNPTPGHTYEWSGDGISGSNTASEVIAFPSIGTITYTVTVTNSDGCTASSSMSVTTNETPEISIDPIPDFCEDQGTTLSVSGSPGTYEWDIEGSSAFGTSASFSGIITGGCVVTVTDALGCVNTAEAELEGFESPDIEILPINPVCENENIILEATGSTGTYIWTGLGLTSTTEQTVFAGGLIAGTYDYSVTVEDTNGCYGTASTTVTVYPNPSIDNIAITDATCGEANGAVEITMAGNANDYSYLLSTGIELDGGNQFSFTGLAPEAYTVDISDNNTNCQISESFTISDLSIIADITIINVNNISCFGANDGIVAYSVTPSIGITTHIEDSDGNSYENGLLPSGNYCIIATDLNDCISDVECFEITEPSLNPTGNTNALFCPGESVTLGVYQAFAAYEWSNFNTTSTISVDIANTYTVTVTDTNGCTATLEYNITEANDCVWPGDANYDGIANNQDVLFLGMAYGNTGQIRNNASINWEGQLAEFEWDSVFNTGINQKHADSDGNGIVEQDDTLAIVQNYNLDPHELREMTGDGYPLYINFEEESEDYGERVEFQINLGDVTQTIPGAYGIAFSIIFNYPEVINPSSIEIDFSNSVLGEEEDLITLSKILLEQGKMDFAITRYDHMDMTNLYGELMSLSFIIEDNIDGFNSTNYTLEASPSDILCIHSWGDEVPIIGNAGNILMLGASSNTNVPTINEGVDYYPNPTKDKLYINMQDNSIIQQVRVFDTLGKLVAEKRSNDIQFVHTHQWMKGMYFVEITNDEGKQYLLKIMKE